MQKRLDRLLDDVRTELRKTKIGYTGLAAKGNSVDVHIADRRRPATELRELFASRSADARSNGQRTLAMTAPAAERFVDSDEAAIKIASQAIAQSIEIVAAASTSSAPTSRHPAPGRRPHPGGAARPAIPTRLKELIGKTAKMSFRSSTLGAPRAGTPVDCPSTTSSWSASVSPSSLMS